ncbi:MULTISPECIES: hypothetical protein [Alkalihalophilus]|uniref:Uncharacterized protein n=1 Tax=Alkalihalophilus pseudofirmus (strain ATCC BAA-2126 / JCM 17055 / OF4) TaxID=398511 RepID=D3G179_ALKPO|nr:MULTISPECIES: hypothetical protein [Alkalihalophilus]PAM96849.1 hypothetical protein B4N84_00060 [Flavobacterium sp. IR1]ADC52105.1 hypothetical protein BpOF4_20549 [Alkalihalophilus pseudofirmus OF4]MEC2074240.1 hypothetical protein [Alkalihalophilus marmarensis]MEC2074470.1 hypothetical protein [Alkalihalophilus marmarensis]WEG19281.1 hypothetical protein PQ478_21585 [Alkalihalophilus pseudofirmus]
MELKRYLSEKPGVYKIVGLAYAQPETNPFTGEKRLGVTVKVGTKEDPVDIKPFLSLLPTVRLQ